MEIGYFTVETIFFVAAALLSEHKADLLRLKKMFAMRCHSSRTKEAWPKAGADFEPLLIAFIQSSVVFYQMMISGPTDICMMFRL